ncbi:MAG: DoxX family protein [Bacteroidetes bacterium]|nr:DoxX family protein [Bacteroidota bacterium]
MKHRPIKTLKIIYWVITGVFIYWMYDPTISSALRYDYAVDFFTKRLGFPKYFLVYTGVTKILGLIALLIPGFPKIKEWVYAGFTYDLVAAIYSLIAIGMPIASLWPQTLALVLLTGSYLCFHKIQNSLLTIKTISDGDNSNKSAGKNA